MTNHDSRECIKTMRIKSLERKIGMFTQLSADEALNEALRLEDICHLIGPFDPAFKHYAEKKWDWEQAAYLLAE